MEVTSSLVLGSPGEGFKVQVVGRGLQESLLDRIRGCLLGSCVDLLPKELEGEGGERVEDSKAVMVLGCSLETACRLQLEAQGRAFLYCGLDTHVGGLVVYSCPGLAGASRCPRPDLKQVTVAQVTASEGSGLVVTSSRQHFLEQGDTLGCGAVVQVISSTEFLVGEEGRSLSPGNLLEVTHRAGRGEHRSLQEELARLQEGEQGEEMVKFARSQMKENCSTQGLGKGMSLLAEQSTAGLLASCLLSLLHDRPLPPGLRLLPLLSCPTPCPLPSPILVSGDSYLARLAASTLQELGLEVTTLAITSPPSSRHLTAQLLSSSSAVVQAGGSYDARRGVEALCVEYSLPLLDLAMAGMAGQAELALPHLTQAYSAVSEPSDPSPPHCVLKSFPHLPEHCAAWAEAKVHSLSSSRPRETVAFCTEWRDRVESPEWSPGVESPESPGITSSGAVVAHKFLSLLGEDPTWYSCVAAARTKWQKYYHHKACQLQSSFAPSSTTSEGQGFWTWPKLLPQPLTWDSAPGSEHLEWVQLVARVLAAAVGVEEEGEVGGLLDKVSVPVFLARDKVIVTDESEAAPEGRMEEEGGLAGLQQMVERSRVRQPKDLGQATIERLEVLSCHLRCDMYGVPRERDSSVLAALGRLEPCLPATAARVVSLGLGELLPHLSSSTSSNTSASSSSSASSTPRNWWVSEGCTFSAPCPAPTLTTLPSGLTVSLWSKLEVRSTGDSFTLQDFLACMKSKYGVEITMVVQESRMVYVPFMPGHKQRLPKPMAKLVKNPENLPFVTLAVTAAQDGEEEEDLTLPPVKYFLA